MGKMCTITYTVEVTEVIRCNDTEFIKKEYADIIRERLKNKMEFDDVKIKGLKVIK